MSFRNTSSLFGAYKVEKSWQKAHTAQSSIPLVVRIFHKCCHKVGIRYHPLLQLTSSYCYTQEKQKGSYCTSKFIENFPRTCGSSTRYYNASPVVVLSYKLAFYPCYFCRLNLCLYRFPKNLLLLPAPINFSLFFMICTTSDPPTINSSTASR